MAMILDFDSLPMDLALSSVYIPSANVFAEPSADNRSGW